MRLLQEIPDNLSGKPCFALAAGLDPQRARIMSENSEKTDPDQPSEEISRLLDRARELDHLKSDLTERIVELQRESEQRQRALHDSEARLRLFIDHAPVALAMFDDQSQCLAVSRRWGADHQIAAPGLVGRSWSDVFPALPEHWDDAHQRGLEGETVRVEEDRLVRKDGSVRWISWEVRPWRDVSGRIGGIVILTEDVTDRRNAEQALRLSEESLRAILETAVDAIVTIDRSGIILSINPAGERMFGYSAAELLGQNVSTLMPSPYCEAHDEYLSRYLQTRERHIIGIGREVPVRRKDGRILPVELAVGEIDHLQRFTGILRDITQRKKLEQEVVEIASSEQRRIGQDLHDSVGQELTALNMLAGDLAEIVAPGNSDADKLVSRIVDGLSRCKAELRSVIRGLLPVPVDALGLMAALTDLAGRTESEDHVNCTFECPGTVSVADNTTATQLYLIAQEAVHNALKHARARHIQIGLSANHPLTLQVEDDGVGILERPKDSVPGNGVGLRIMRNRAAIIGATITVERGPEHGTRVVCTLPR